MSYYKKYAKNGVCNFENFQQNLEIGHFPIMDLTVAGGVEWKVQLRSQADEVYPVIWNINNDPNVYHSTRIYLNFPSKDDFHTDHLYSIPYDECVIGPHIETSLIDLENGTLVMEYGISVEGTKNGVWTFNFLDRLHGNEGMVILHSKETALFSSPFLLSFHSDAFKCIQMKCCQMHHLVPEPIDFVFLEEFLQICHGVQIQISSFHRQKVMEIAEYYGIHNVIRYCEMSFIRDFETAFNKNQCIEVIFTLSIMYNLRRMMATVLRNIETRDELMRMVKKVDVDGMTGELMKMIVTWVFCDD